MSPKEILQLNKLLTSKEMEFVLFLLSEDRYFTRREIVREVWNNCIQIDTFRISIHRIRQKVGSQTIQFYPQKGYKLYKNKLLRCLQKCNVTI